MARHAYTHKISERRHSSWRCHINKRDISHTRLEQRQKKNTETTFASPSRFGVK